MKIKSIQSMAIVAVLLSFLVTPALAAHDLPDRLRH
jgi:hypothetical protein